MLNKVTSFINAFREYRRDPFITPYSATRLEKEITEFLFENFITTISPVGTDLTVIPMAVYAYIYSDQVLYDALDLYGYTQEMLDVIESYKIHQSTFCRIVVERARLPVCSYKIDQS